jgi:hypothetical protein
MIRRRRGPPVEVDDPIASHGDADSPDDENRGGGALGGS